MAMYLKRVWLKNGSVFIFELEICICIEVWKRNVFVFDLAELYLYLIPKCVFEPNPDRRTAHLCRRRSNAYNFVSERREH